MVNSLSDDEGFVEALDNERLVEILRERTSDPDNQTHISFDELIEKLGFTREELEADLGSQRFEQQEHPELSIREWMLRSMDDGSDSLMTNNIIDSKQKDKDKADYIKSREQMALAQVPQELLAYGELEVVTVFAYYDGPKLFSLYSKEKNVYLLVFWAHEDEENNSNTSLYLPLSEKNYLLTTAGEVNLYDAFSLAEDGNVLAVKTSYDGQEDVYSVNETNYSDISDDWLPTREAFLGKPKG